MTYRKLSVRLFDDATDAFKRTIPPSWRTPWVPVVDIIPNLPSTTDQGDREEERKRRLKPIQYPSKDSPDRGLSYYDVYPVARKGPKEGQAEMAGQPFEFLNAIRTSLGGKRPKRPRLRKQLDYGIPERRNRCR